MSRFRDKISGFHSHPWFSAEGVFCFWSRFGVKNLSRICQDFGTRLVSRFRDKISGFHPHPLVFGRRCFFGGGVKIWCQEFVKNLSIFRDKIGVKISGQDFGFPPTPLVFGRRCFFLVSRFGVKIWCQELVSRLVSRFRDKIWCQDFGSRFRESLPLRLSKGRFICCLVMDVSFGFWIRKVFRVKISGQDFGSRLVSRFREKIGVKISGEDWCQDFGSRLVSRFRVSTHTPGFRQKVFFFGSRFRVKISDQDWCQDFGRRLVSRFREKIGVKISGQDWCQDFGIPLTPLVFGRSFFFFRVKISGQDLGSRLVSRFREKIGVKISGEDWCQDFGSRLVSRFRVSTHTPGFRPKVFLFGVKIWYQDFGSLYPCVCLKGGLCVALSWMFLSGFGSENVFRGKIGGRSGQDRGKIGTRSGQDRGKIGGRFLPEKIFSRRRLMTTGPFNYCLVMDVSFGFWIRFCFFLGGGG